MKSQTVSDTNKKHNKPRGRLVRPWNPNLFHIVAPARALLTETTFAIIVFFLSFCPIYIGEFKLICIRLGSAINHSQILLLWRYSKRPLSLPPRKKINLKKAKQNKKETPPFVFLTSVVKPWFVPFSAAFYFEACDPFLHASSSFFS